MIRSVLLSALLGICPMTVAHAAHETPPEGTELTTTTGYRYVTVTHQRLGSGFRDETGLSWYVQTNADGQVIDDANYAEAEYLCQLRGGVVPTLREVSRFRSTFGDVVSDVELPTWFTGLDGHRFWTSTPNGLGRGGNGAWYYYMYLFEAAKSYLITDDQASRASVLCVHLD